MVENHIPFAVALKTGLLTSEKKSSTLQSAAKKSKTESHFSDAHHDKKG